ncbi:hypothetical protein K7X08_035684 [Anisodus acutangulus]|uniref:Uncharacterized protein n=1 Tax=Anisodus acutangulus TaxID=402998 RepID=A0A9Q1MAB6_9SOLA|nr:hypothetical protein K7X08_035684 [Anisodus acutangulus]
MVKDRRVFSDPSKSKEGDVTTKNKFNILQEEEKTNGSNKYTTVPEEMVLGQETNNGDIAVFMSNSAEKNKKEGSEKLCNEGSKTEGEKEWRTMQNDNVTTMEWVENSLFGHKTKVEVVKENNVDEQMNVSDQQVNVNNVTEEMNISGVVEKPGD